MTFSLPIVKILYIIEVNLNVLIVNQLFIISGLSTVSTLTEVLILKIMITIIINFYDYY